MSEDDLTRDKIEEALRTVADLVRRAGDMSDRGGLGPKRPRIPYVGSGPEHPLLTVPETARRLGCSAMTIRRRIDARRFPAVKIGSKAMVPRSFVDHVLALAESGSTVIVEEAAAEWMAANAGAAP